MSKLKVYGWTGTHSSPGSRQSRNIIAATSVAEARRLAGIRRSFYALGGEGTTSPDEVAVAMSKPGTMFWRPLDDREAGWVAQDAG